MPRWLRPTFTASPSGAPPRSPRTRKRHKVRTEAVCLACAMHVVVVFLHDDFCEEAVLRRRWRPPPSFADVCLTAARRLARLPKLKCGGRGTLDALLSDLMDEIKQWQPYLSSQSDRTPFVGARLALPSRGEGAAVPLEKFGLRDLMEALVQPGPPVLSDFSAAEAAAGWTLPCPAAGCAAVPKDADADRFIVTRLPGNAQEAMSHDCASVHLLDLPRGSFTPKASEWKTALRRMARAGMICLLAPDAEAGLLANSLVAPLSQHLPPARALKPLACSPDGGIPVELPRVDRLCRLRLQPQELLRVHLRDLSNMYHRLRVPAARVAAQSLGPRLPVEWFADLDNEHTDGLFAGERPWWYSDVRGPGAGPPPHGYVQPACVSLVMGCHRAVGVAQAVALRSVVGSGLLDAGTYLWEDADFPASGLVGGVYIDDTGLVAVAPVDGDPAAGPDFDIMRRVDQCHDENNMGQATHKAIRGQTVAKLWGALIEGGRGVIGTPWERRAVVLAAGLLLAGHGGLESQIATWIGHVSFAFLFRRPCFSVLGEVYSVVARHPPARQKFVHLRGPVLIEVISAAFLQALSETNLRAPLHRRLLASDATPSMAGFVHAEITAARADKLFAAAESRGEYVRLDWVATGAPPPAQSTVDRCLRVAALLRDLPWESAVGVQFQQVFHINEQELRAALICLGRQLSKFGRRGAGRWLIVVDSRVVHGAVRKGRSSSRRLNHLLRRLCAICLAHGIYVEILWVPSKSNPSDAPTRHMDLADWLLENAGAVPATAEAADAVAADAAAGAATSAGLTGDLCRTLARHSEGSRTSWICADRRAGAAVELLKLRDLESLTVAVQFSVQPLLQLLPQAGRLYMVLSSGTSSSAVAARYPRLSALLWQLAEAACGGDSFNTVVLLIGSSRRQCARHFSEDPSLRTKSAHPIRVLSWGDGQESAGCWRSAPPEAFLQHWPACRGAAFSLRVAWAIPTAAAEEPTAPRLVGAHRRRRKLLVGPEPRAPPRLLDAFAGSGALEAAARAEGWVVDRVELLDGPNFDLTNPKVLDEYCRRISAGHYQWLHTGPPCGSFGRLYLNGPGWRTRVTRTVDRPQGNGTSGKENMGNLCARAAARLLETARLAGVVCTHEQPDGSWMSRLPCFRRLAARGPWHCFRWAHCAYGAPWRKLSELWTTCEQLGSVCLLCPGGAGHRPHRVRLQGTVRVQGRTVNRTALAAQYPRRFCRRLAKAVSDVVRQGARYGLRGVKVGEASHPGPRHYRGVAPPLRPGLFTGTGTLAATTISAYDRAIAKFAAWYTRHRRQSWEDVFTSDSGRFFADAMQYLDFTYQHGQLSAPQAGQFISGLLNATHRMLAEGRLRVEVLQNFAPLWKGLSRWKHAEPGDHRLPVERNVVLAAAGVATAWGCEQAGWLFVCGFHCLLRAAHLPLIRWCDVYAVGHLGPQAPSGVLSIMLPKRTGTNPSRVQHVTLEDTHLVAWFAALRSDTGAPEVNLVWPHGARHLQLLWRACMTQLGIDHVGYTLAGLRGGGTAYGYLCFGNIPRIRWREVWRQERTLENYFQESMVWLAVLRIQPAARGRIEELAGLTAALMLSFSDHCAAGSWQSNSCAR